MEHRQALAAALRSFAAIDLRDAIYLACPISSGRREVDLMLGLGVFDREHLRTTHVTRWRDEVLEPNKAAAAEAVDRTRRRHPGRPVINPVEFELDGLSQAHYDALCEQVIRDHVGAVTLAAGWEYSRGARLEVELALDLGLPITDVSGDELTGDHLVRELARVSEALIVLGVPADHAHRLYPVPEPDGSPSAGRDRVHGLQLQQ
ncbi:DUF4406 domain-containing protein [Actinokineospora enzanensis]|uniref:DUF4406 domain-containing protein n=1 Tax=Actinokineospora enzanensis TaxID=155975 RepID=UPI00036081BA|nr:DUF4406 domain-containing protein [Actinokineospora enzanensis]